MPKVSHAIFNCARGLDLKPNHVKLALISFSFLLSAKLQNQPRVCSQGDSWTSFTGSCDEDPNQEAL